MENSKHRIEASRITKIGICISLLCVSAYISVQTPISPAPITAQTIIINLIAIILLPRDAFFAVLGYLLIGICGVPVFSGGAAGIGKLLGPTGGYLVGYLFVAVLMSFIFSKIKTKNKLYIYLIVTIFVGIPVIYLCGVATMRLYVGKGLWQILSASVLPFIPGDLIKCVIGSYLGAILNKRLNIRER